MKINFKMHPALVAIIVALTVIAIVVMCTSVLGHVLNGVKPPSDDKYKSLTAYTFDVNASSSYGASTKVSYYGYEDIYAKDGTGGQSGIFSTHIGDGNFYMTINGDNMESGDRYDNYAYFGKSYEIESGYLCMVFDVDVSAVDFGESCSVGFRPDYRNTSGGQAYSDATLYRYYNGGEFKNVNGTHVASDIPENFHFTYVLWYDGRADIYLNGELMLTIKKAYTNACTHIEGLRMAFTCTDKGSLDGFPTVVIDNVKIMEFKEGYTGPIHYLHDNPDVDLHVVKDTVLGGGY